MKSESPLPIINVRDLVVFPKSRVTLYIGRRETSATVEYALEKHQGAVVVITQRAGEKASVEGIHDMFQVGTLCKILERVAFPDNTMKVLIEGKEIFKVTGVESKENVRIAHGCVLEPCDKTPLSSQQREELLNLLIRVHPGLPLDVESLGELRELINEENSQALLGSAMNLAQRKSRLLQLETKSKSLTAQYKTPDFDSQDRKLDHERTMKCQEILEEQNQGQKLEKMRHLLISRAHHEICMG
jgi:ATP-dependent Lon protease